jgi:hypothetical protein
MQQVAIKRETETISRSQFPHKHLPSNKVLRERERQTDREASLHLYGGWKTCKPSYYFANNTEHARAHAIILQKHTSLGSLE